MYLSNIRTEGKGECKYLILNWYLLLGILTDILCGPYWENVYINISTLSPFRLPSASFIYQRPDPHPIFGPTRSLKNPPPLFRCAYSSTAPVDQSRFSLVLKSLPDPPELPIRHPQSKGSALQSPSPVPYPLQDHLPESFPFAYQQMTSQRHPPYCAHKGESEEDISIESRRGHYQGVATISAPGFDNILP